MKKTLVFLAVLVLLVTGCNSKKEITVGKYYLGNDNDVYIEIIDNERIAFHNVDFSVIEATWLSEFEVEVDIAEIIESEYSTNDNFDRIYVLVKEDGDAESDGFRAAIHMGYSSKDKTITLSDIIYTKR